MNISGRIHKILTINDYIISVVLKKSRNKSPYFVSLLFYYQMSDVIKEHYKESDFVKIWFRVRSNQRISNGTEKYYTDLIGEQILLVKREGRQIEKVYNEMGLPTPNTYVDSSSGEVITRHNLKEEIRKNSL